MISAFRSRIAAVGNPDRGLFFPLFGFPVRINHSFWLLALLAAWQGQRSPGALLGWLLVVVVSILAHELGHALVASRWAVVWRINLHFAGGMTTWRSLEPLPWSRHLAISLAGPAAGLALALLAHGIQAIPVPPLVFVAARHLAVVNVAWSLFNLLPILPLDGGQALKAALVEYLPRKGELVTAGIGLAVAFAGALAAIAMGQPWALAVFAWCGYVNGQPLWIRYRDRSRSQWQTLSDRDQVRERY